MLGVALLIVLALAVLATWIVGRVYRASETDRVDARLSSALRVAAGGVVAVDTEAMRSARSLAGSRAVQRALVRNDAAALSAFALRRGAVSLTVRTIEKQPPKAAPGTVVRTVLIRGPRGTIGAVDVVEHLDVVLHRVAVQTATVLRFTTPSGPQGRPYDLRIGGRSYRAVHVRFGSGVDVLALVRRDEIASAVRHRQLLTFAAALLTAAALALVALVLLPRRVARRRNARDPLALFGDVIAAAHDPELLLPVILETTVVATGAAGGTVTWDGETVAEVHSEERPSAERLILSLDDEAPDRLLILDAPRAGFTAADHELAHSLAGHGRIALENARLHGVVRHQAATDDLTDLANRRRFMDALRQEVARSARLEVPLSLVLFDLDHFKQINDRCGHQAGDDVLRSAASVIRERVRETDLAARVGGEEFAVILPGTDRDGAVSLAENLRRDLADRVVVPDDEITLTASFGVAEHQAGHLAEALIGAADRALYRAKAEGRNRVSVEEVDPDPQA
jgi:diguanylate cyclase (GGDEF)-like protein